MSSTVSRARGLNSTCQSARFGEGVGKTREIANLTLDFSLLSLRFLLLLPQKQARPVAVQARPAAWCPGLDAPEHLTGT